MHIFFLTPYIHPQVVSDIRYTYMPRTTYPICHELHMASNTIHSHIVLTYCIRILFVTHIIHPQSVSHILHTHMPRITHCFGHPAFTYCPHTLYSHSDTLHTAHPTYCAASMKSPQAFTCLGSLYFGGIDFNMYIHMCAYQYVYIYICIYLHVYITHLPRGLHVPRFIVFRRCVFAYVHMHVRISIYIHICIYMCAYIHITYSP